MTNVIIHFYRKRKVYTITVVKENISNINRYEAASTEEVYKVADFLCSVLTLYAIPHHRLFGGVPDADNGQTTDELASGCRITAYNHY